MKVKMLRMSAMIGSLIWFAQASAQEPNCVYLASDIYPGSYGAAPGGFTEYNGAIYFSATGDMNGVELWKLENGVTSIVADINPGIGGSMPNNFTVMGGYLYFSATTATTGSELYRYDGVSVTLAADIYPGAQGSFPNTFAVVGGNLYFSANDGTTGFEPWKFNGTTATLIQDLNPGMAGSTPSEIVGFGGNVYYTATTDAAGEELWKYNGTTMTLFDIYPGTTGSDIGELTPIPGKLCFRATDGVNGYELWTYDGTTLTNLNVNPTSDFTPWELTAVGSELLLRGFIASTGYELWKYNGTTASLVMDIRPGTANSTPNNLYAVGNTLYFAAHNGTNGNELWYYDGTTTALAADIKTGSGSSMAAPSYDPFASVNDIVFFIAEDGTTGNEVWSYNGTTHELGKNIVAGVGTPTPSGLKGIGNTLYFMADNGINGAELWAWNPYADLTDTIAVTTCDIYVSPAGNAYITPGTYSLDEVIPSSNCPGCDSLIHIDLLITDQPSSTLDVVACNEYISPAGTYFGTVGTYNFTETIQSIACPSLDSIITINLEIVANINPAIVVFSGVLVAQQPGATYQWLDCDNGYAPVPGATDQDFLPTVSGNYACEITLGCTDTSNCYYVESTWGSGITELGNSSVYLYPNPVSDQLTLVAPNGVQLNQIRIVNSLGDTVRTFTSNENAVVIDVNDLSSGIYYILAETSAGETFGRFVRQ